MRTVHRTAAAYGLISLILPMLLLSTEANAAAGENTFSRSSVDIGVVVSDMEASLKFYTKAIGFQEKEGFSVSGSLARSIGLTEGASLNVRVLVLSDEKSATKLKLIEVPDGVGEGSKSEDKPVIDSQLGFRYLTIFVRDMNRALKRLEEYGDRPDGEGPVELGRDAPSNVSVMLIRDPDGNVVELVGPRIEAE